VIILSAQQVAVHLAPLWWFIADCSRLSSFLQRQLVVSMMMMMMMMMRMVMTMTMRMMMTMTTASSSPVLIRLTFPSYADSQHFPVAKLHQAPADANADADYHRRSNAV
jgi:hypothetical protein